MNEAQVRAREALFARLERSAGWIHNILAKKVPYQARHHSVTKRDSNGRTVTTREESNWLPPELTWINLLSSKLARWEFTDDEAYPLQVTAPTTVKDEWSGREHQTTQTHRVPAVFLRGDMWRICQATRRYLYLHQRAEALKENHRKVREHQEQERQYQRDQRELARRWEAQEEEFKLAQARAENTDKRWAAYCRKKGLPAPTHTALTGSDPERRSVATPKARRAEAAGGLR